MKGIYRRIEYRDILLEGEPEADIMKIESLGHLSKLCDRSYERERMRSLEVFKRPQAAVTEDDKDEDEYRWGRKEERGTREMI